MRTVQRTRHPAGPAARIRRIARLVVAALASGAAGGALAGLGARLIMFAFRLTNGAFNGATTHAGYENGRWTLEGTSAVVMTGIFFGLPGGTIYLLARSGLGRRRVVRWLAFGVLMLAAFGTDVLDGSYEYSRFVSPSISVAAFASLFPLYGVAVAGVADAIAPPGPARRPRLRTALTAALVVLGAASAWQLLEDLRFRYGF